MLALSPVNYSVASNEDVFELIKFDLLSELLVNHRENFDVNDNDFKFFESLFTRGYYSIYNSKNLLKTFRPLFRPSTELASAKYPVIAPIVAFLEKVFKSISESVKKIQRDDGAVSREYTLWTTNRKGSIYERDEITFLLIRYIKSLKENTKTEIVLLIDDLDRLDPEHTFRLCNIFSAHYEVDENLNKFGVDKIIFVCDYKNIKQMYSHRYGEGVDFQGYMDKYYSTQVFNFDTRWQPITSMLQIIMGLKRDSMTYFHYGYPANMGYPQTNDVNFIPIAQALSLLIVDLIAIEAITFRDVSKLMLIDIPSYYQIKIYDVQYHYYTLDFLVVMRQLKKIIDLGEYLKLMDKLRIYCHEEYITKFPGVYMGIDRWFAQRTLLYIIDHRLVKQTNGHNRFTKQIAGQHYSFTFNIQDGVVQPKSIYLEKLDKSTIQFYDFIETATQLLKEAGHL